MGADLLIISVPYPSDKDWKPDFERGRAFIKELREEWEKGGQSDAEEEAESLESYLDEFEEIWEGGRRDTTTHTFGAQDAIITGGMSWGDNPTESYSVISYLDEYNVLEACGFYPPVIDWKKLFELALDKGGSKLLPLLMGLDPDLDAIIKEKLKEGE